MTLIYSYIYLLFIFGVEHDSTIQYNSLYNKIVMMLREIMVT
jgi:hypothetical protein